MNRERADKIAEDYEKLRKECFRLARENDGELMAGDEWLRFAMDENDIELWPGTDGIHCTGTCFSMQTQSNEYFSFTIPYNRIRL